MKPMYRICLLVLLCSACKERPTLPLPSEVRIDTLQVRSLLGKELLSQQLQPKDSTKVHKYLTALKQFQEQQDRPDTHIWLGRRMAYLGDYKAAIAIFSEGLERFPNDARLYRHRGHRYISVRQLDQAIQDLEKATQLIQGKEDIVEPDGIPNRLNTPVSSLHTNIYYHLGLAYYLKADWRNALINFQSCLDASTNDDMRVAASHWLYMILRRMNLTHEAQHILEPITSDMSIIENDAYHKLLLFYKGSIPESALSSNSALGSSEAVKYGLARWYHYNGDIDTAKTLYQDLIANGNWAGFGYIAAEAELSRLP